MEEEAEASGGTRQQSHEWVGEGSRRVTRWVGSGLTPRNRRSGARIIMGLALQALLQHLSSLFRAAS